MTDEEIYKVQYDVQYSEGGFTPTKFARAILAAEALKAQPVQPAPLTDVEIAEAAKSLGIGSYQTLAAAFKAGVQFAESTKHHLRDPVPMRWTCFVCHKWAEHCLCEPDPIEGDKP